MSITCTISWYWFVLLNKMALYKYFKKESILPNPNGSLSESMPSSSIAQANLEVKPILSGKASAQEKKPRGAYIVFTEEEKAMVAKRAAEVGVTNVLRIEFCKFLQIKAMINIKVL